MARKNKVSAAADYVMFDVLYEDGARTSNRRLPASVAEGYDAEGQIRAMIEAQDREIAEMSGRPRGPIKSITRSATKDK